MTCFTKIKNFVRSMAVLAIAVKDLRQRVATLERAMDQIGAMADIEWSEKYQCWRRFGDVDQHERDATFQG